MTRLELMTDASGAAFIDADYLKKVGGRISGLTATIAVAGARTRLKGVVITEFGDAVKFSYVIDTPSRRVAVGDLCYCIRDGAWTKFLKKTKHLNEMAPYAFNIHTGCSGMVRAEFTHKEEKDGGSIQNSRRTKKVSKKCR